MEHGKIQGVDCRVENEVSSLKAALNRQGNAHEDGGHHSVV